jgi:hypothetical protein
MPTSLAHDLWHTFVGGRVGSFVETTAQRELAHLRADLAAIEQHVRGELVRTAAIATGLFIGGGALVGGVIAALGERLPLWLAFLSSGVVVLLAVALLWRRRRSTPPLHTDRLAALVVLLWGAIDTGRNHADTRTERHSSSAPEGP